MAYRSNAERMREIVTDNYSALDSGDEAREIHENYYGDPPRRNMFLNAYELGQVRGGYEEGGWWVTTLEPLASIPVNNLTDAFAAINQLDAFLRDQYEDEREYTSAAGGADGTIQFEPHFAKFQPDDPEAFRYS